MSTEVIVVFLRAVSFLMKKQISPKEALMMVGLKVLPLPETRKLREEGNPYIPDLYSFLYEEVLKEPRSCREKGGEAKELQAVKCD